MSPHKVATELFPKQDRNNTDTNITGIAIATRFGRDGATQEYITALSQNGYTVRWMQGHSAMYDFCAMRRSTELVGIVRSTFVVWAALLGHGRARLYSVKSPVTVEKSTRMGNPYFRTYNWSHPELKRRIQFELYQSEAMDEQQPQ